MIEIVLTICAIAAPKDCHEERIPVWDEKLTLLGCIMNAPAAIADVDAEWKAGHPGWRIAGYQCRERRADEKDT